MADGGSLRVDTRLFREDAELMAFRAVEDLEAKCSVWLSKGEYAEYFAALAALGAPLAVFFEKVLVNAPEENLKLNRLALLLRVRGLYEQVADFSKVQA